MKSDDVKTAAGFEAIKAKALQFPPGLIDIKPSTARSNINPDAFETTSPSLYALRFLSSTSSNEALKSRLSKSRAKDPAEPDTLKENQEKHLPTVELTISKKIKFPHNKKQTFGKARQDESQLTASDRVIIEELRHHLRGQPRNGTTSVLEAIGDPEVREQRLYYEPLKSFLQDKDESERKSFMDGGLRVVDIMIPSFEKRLQTDSRVVLPLTVTRHHAAVSRNANRLRGGANVTYLPKVVGSSMMGNMDKKNSQTNQLRFYYPEIPTQDTITNLPPPKRKTQLNLPRIGIKRDEIEHENDRAKFKRRNGVNTVNETQRRSEAATVQLPIRQEVDSFGPSNGFPRRATTTATGKAHLIGPMNKMDMIADYSKALQSGAISYNDYIKKISVLSLHKVNLSNSSQRHFHLIRDESNNMKPKLTHVDVTPSSTHHVTTSSEQDTNRSQDPNGNKESSSEGTDSQKAESKFGQSQIHRIDIGEGLSLLEKNKPDVDPTDDFILTDLTRYTHAHHPRQGRLTHYHWSHEGGAVFGAGTDQWHQRQPLPWQSPNQASFNYPKTSSKFRETSRQEKEVSKAKPKVLLSMEEYLKLHSPRQTNTTGQAMSKQELSAIGEYGTKTYLNGNFEEVSSMQENLEYIGKIPIPVEDTEPMGLGAKDIMKAVDFKLPGNPIKEEAFYPVDDLSDVDSVFQSHLDNMMKTIKKAKASKKRQVPELKGLVPTVVPQLRFDSMRISDEKKGEKDLEKKTKDVEQDNQANVNFLEVNKPIPENTPPPTAKKAKGSEFPSSALASQSESTSSDQLILRSSSLDIPEKPDLLLNVLETPRKPSTPKSVQSNRSFKITVPGAILEESSGQISNTEIRIMTASVDLHTPSADDDASGADGKDRSRLEVVITSMPAAPPASIATSSEEGSVSGNEE